MIMLLAARPKGLGRPAHAVEFLEDEDGEIVTDTKTLCGRLQIGETDLDVTKPQAFGDVPPDEQCATCCTFSTAGGRFPIARGRSVGPI